MQDYEDDSHEDRDENRILVEFDGKPAPEVREACKRHGFKWAPSRTAWVRKITANGQAEAERLADELANMEEQGA